MLVRFPAYEALFLGIRALVAVFDQAEDWERVTEFLLTLAMERLRTKLD